MVLNNFESQKIHKLRPYYTLVNTYVIWFYSLSRTITTKNSYSDSVDR